MVNLRVRTIDEAELQTVLAEDFSFDGTIEFDRPLLVKGRVVGEFKSESDIFIAENAQLNANVQARRVSIKGKLTGNVIASHRIKLFAGAVLCGDIETPDLVIQSGGRFSGSCRMTENQSGE